MIACWRSPAKGGPSSARWYPTRPDVLTSDKGWDLDPAQMAVAREAIAALEHWAHG